MYGLRFKRPNETFVFLLQIGGGGRLKLSDGIRVWWSDPPSGVTWESYEATEGHLVESKAGATKTAANLVKGDPANSGAH